MPNGWRTIKSLVHKIWLHGRRGKGMAESFSREKLRHAPQKEGGWKILCDLPPVWPRGYVQRTWCPEWLGRKHTHTHTHIGRINASGIEWLGMTRPDCAVMCNLINTHTHTHTPCALWLAGALSCDCMFWEEKGGGLAGQPVGPLVDTTIITAVMTANRVNA